VAEDFRLKRPTIIAINKPPFRRRRKFQFGLRSLFLGVFAVAVVCFVLRDVPMAQPIDGILGLLLGNETIYGPSYSEFGWIRVRLGMSEAEVKALLGEPLKTVDNGRGKEVVWMYTLYGPSETYHIREISFTGGYVSKKHAQWWMD